MQTGSLAPEHRCLNWYLYTLILVVVNTGTNVVVYSGTDIVVGAGWRGSRVVMFTAIRLRGLRFKPWPGQKFENKNFCFRRTPAVVKACHPCTVRPIKTPLYKT